MSEHEDKLAEHFRHRDSIVEWLDDSPPVENSTLFAEAILASAWLADLIAEHRTDASRPARRNVIRGNTVVGPRFQAISDADARQIREALIRLDRTEGR